MSDNISEARADQVKQQVSLWLESQWRVDIDLMSWRKILLASGYAAADWPEAYYGLGYNKAETAIVEQVFAEKGALGAADVGPRSLAAATILAHGNHIQKRRYLAGILSGEDSWCQLFSEPGSGSDLAGATTRADLENSVYRVNGQKVWTTSAHHADFGIMLARTNWDEAKHQGLSFFIIDMRQQGVEVRPLKQMNGHASFNLVFFDDAEVAEENRLGDEGEGWKIAQTTLGFERTAFSRANKRSSLGNKTGQVYDEFRDELSIANEPYVWYPQRAGRPDLASVMAERQGKVADPILRQAMARLITLQQSAAYSAKRRVASSVIKLAASLIAQQANIVHNMIADQNSMVMGKSSLEEGLISEILLSTPAISIAGGTDEIQRNIIAERILGLPKEPRFDTGPFRDVKTNVT